MENKIVYLKTYIMTIVVLVIMFAIAMGAVVYHYENKMQELKQMNNEKRLETLEQKITDIGLYIKNLYMDKVKGVVSENDYIALVADFTKDRDKLIKEKEECIVIEHSINKGKGQALKTGFTYYLENLMQDYLGIVTADSDGQHSIEDTINIAKLVEEYKDVKTLILGVRNFNKENVPFASKFGNKLTKTIFKLLYNKTINDTQTGLRGFTNSYIKDCIDIPGNRYEYEMNMLIYATKSEITILEKKIDTIYIEENKSSHFNPIKDSIKIYKILLN